MKRILKKLSILLLTIIIIFSMTCSASAASINKKKVTLYTGQTVQLKVSGTTKKIKWTSSNKSVATVTSKGKVSAKKKGQATIIAKIGSKKYTCKITVNIKSKNVYELSNCKYQYVSSKIVTYRGHTFLKSVFDFTNKSSYSMSPSVSAATWVTQGKYNCGYDTLNLFPKEISAFDNVPPHSKKRVYYLSEIVNLYTPVKIKMSELMYYGKPKTKTFEIKIKGLSSISISD